MASFQRSQKTGGHMLPGTPTALGQDSAPLPHVLTKSLTLVMEQPRGITEPEERYSGGTRSPFLRNHTWNLGVVNSTTGRRVLRVSRPLACSEMPAAAGHIFHL